MKAQTSQDNRSAMWQKPFVAQSTYEAVLLAIGKLEAVLETEMNALKSGGTSQLPELTRRKEQGLLELSRLMRSLEGAIPSQDIIKRLRTFRKALDRNSAMLGLYLQATREVTATIVRVMQEVESDGTYSRSFCRGSYDFG